MEPIVVHPGREPDQKEYTPEDFTAMYEFLSDEWQAADTYLNQLGFPAQTEDEFGQFEYCSLTKRIMLALGDDEED